MAEDRIRTSSPGGGRFEWRFVLRSVTALMGSYAAAAALASLLARVLPIARAEATAWGLILSFLLFASLGLWAFHEVRLARVTAVIWGSAVFSLAVVLLLGPKP